LLALRWSLVSMVMPKSAAKSDPLVSNKPIWFGFERVLINHKYTLEAKLGALVVANFSLSWNCSSKISTSSDEQVLGIAHL
jgi:hypothetical protein